MQGLHRRTSAIVTSSKTRLVRSSSFQSLHHARPNHVPWRSRTLGFGSHRSALQASSRHFSTSATLCEVPYPSRPWEGAEDIRVEAAILKKTPRNAWKLPPGAWDTHFHIFDPAYPYSPTRSFTPPAAPRDSFEHFNSSLTLTGSPTSLVLVQPSVYGTDNSLTFNFLRKEQKKAQNRDVRAIVVLDLENTSDQELIDMHELGVRGIRFNMAASGKDVLASDINERILRVAMRLEGLDMLRNWFLQLFIPGHLWEGIESTIQNLPFRIIADHQGGMKGTTLLSPFQPTTSQAGFTSLLRLAKAGKVFIKISAQYRSSRLTEGGYDDLEELIKIFAREVPNQLLWGSDWPHTGSSKDRPARGIDVIEPLRKVDNVAALKNLRKWMGERVWEKMMVENPKRMYL